MKNDPAKKDKRSKGKSKSKKPKANKKPTGKKATPPKKEMVQKKEYCTKCGKVVDAEDLFCRNCGTQIIRKAPAEKEKKTEEKTTKSKPKEKPPKKPPKTKRKETTKPKKEQPPTKKKSSTAPAILFVIIVGGILAWFFLFSNKATIQFDIRTRLATDEPGISDIYINGQKIQTTDASGKASFTYGSAQVGDKMKVTFKKRGQKKYKSLGDFELLVNNREMKVTRTISFQRIIQWYTVNIQFQRTEKFPAIITLNGDTIGSLVDNPTYVFSKKYKDEENQSLAFQVLSADYQIITDPPSLVYTVNRNISATVNVYALLNTTPVLKYTFLEKLSRVTLSDVEVNFSDSKETATTNKAGIIIYPIREKKLGAQVSIKLPQKFIKPISPIKPILIKANLPDTLVDTVLCEVKYTIRVVVEDLNEQPISKATVTLEKETKKTNRKGIAEFQIPRPDKYYNLKINKSKYKTFSTPIHPTAFIYTDTIKMEMIYGTITLLDSLQNDVAIPYVDIFEGNERLGQTDKDGRCKIPILLMSPMKLDFRPPRNSIYLPKRTDVTFEQIHEIKEFKLSPKPFVYTFQVNDDRGRAVSNVRITNRSRTYTTDKKGKVSIKLFIVEPAEREEFNISWGNYQDRRYISREEGQREYFTPVTIPSTVPVEIRTSPPNGNVTVIDMTGKTVAIGVAPLKAALEFGRYRIKARNDMGQSADETREITGTLKEPIVIDMQNPIALMEIFYQKGDYQRVTKIYLQDSVRIQRLLATTSPYRENKCDHLKHISVAFSLVNQHRRAADMMGKLEEDGCLKSNPKAYRNYAGMLFKVQEWEKAAAQYLKAIEHIHYVPEAERYQFHADCLYGLTLSMLNNYIDKKNRSPLPCSYLNDISQYLNEYINLVEKQDLKTNIGSVNNTRLQLQNELEQCGG